MSKLLLHDLFIGDYCCLIMSCTLRIYSYALLGSSTVLQVRQRADDVRKSLDLLQLLNDGAEICNMMEGYFDFQQFQVCMYHFVENSLLY